MRRNTINFDTVRGIAATFPGLRESTAHGVPALKLKGELLACMPANRSAEQNSLLVRVGIEERAELLAWDPAAFYVTDHYANYTGVLVRLTRVDRGKRGTCLACHANL